MSKQITIQNYIDTIAGNTVTTTDLCNACKCTLPTILTFIKNHPDRFEKVKRGTYTIKHAALSTVPEIQNQSNNQSFDWD